MLELGIKTLLAYLLGTLLASLLFGWFRGVDIRRLGSGNAGATNAMRTQGKKFGLAVLVWDIGKGLVAVLGVPVLGWSVLAQDAEIDRRWLAVACGLAVIVGHVYPVWFGFRGGKGVATVIGAVAALAPVLLLPMLGAWIAIVLLTGYVGLASILSGVSLMAAVVCLDSSDGPLLVFCAGACALLIYTHRSNIARMRSGTESRARLWLFRPRAA